MTIPGNMSPEQFWLAMTVLATAMMWLPYVLNRIAVNGLGPTLGFTRERELELSNWGWRARAAHANAVENLVIFLPVVMLAHVLGVSTPLTILAAMGYFCARMVHYVVYVLGIPMLRTLAFAAGWVCQLTFMASIFHVI